MGPLNLLAALSQTGFDLNKEATKRPPEHLEGITAPSLMGLPFPEARWAVPGILPEGLSLLGGKPKKGKSLLALNIALRIAAGQKVLGKFDITPGKVLYFALEDSKRRLQERIDLMLDGQPAPENLILYNKIRRMNAGLGDLAQEIDSHSDVRLVIIDTFALFRPINKYPGQSHYDVDYQHVNAIKKIADERCTSILLVHHIRKAPADDIWDTVSGTNGLTGAADGLIALVDSNNSRTNAQLSVTGRDVESKEFNLTFDEERLMWSIAGETKDMLRTVQQQKLYDTICTSENPLTIKNMVEATGLREQYIKNTLPKLIGNGRVRKTQWGEYESIKT
jgi:RecA-family ATPase